MSAQRTACKTHVGLDRGHDGGLDHLRDVIVADALGICADLDAAMARARRRLTPTSGRVYWRTDETGPVHVPSSTRQARPTRPSRSARSAASACRCSYRSGGGGQMTTMVVRDWTNCQPERGVAVLLPTARRRRCPHPRRAVHAVVQYGPVRRRRRAVAGDRGRPGRRPGRDVADRQAGVRPADRPVPRRTKRCPCRCFSAAGA